MMWANDGIWGGWGWHAFPMLLVWGGLILAVVLLIRWLLGRQDESPAVGILKQRYAKGEIDAEEFKRMMLELRRQ